MNEYRVSLSYVDNVPGFVDVVPGIGGAGRGGILPIEKEHENRKLNDFSIRYSDFTHTKVYLIR